MNKKPYTQWKPSLLLKIRWAIKSFLAKPQNIRVMRKNYLAFKNKKRKWYEYYKFTYTILEDNETK